MFTFFHVIKLSHMIKTHIPFNKHVHTDILEMHGNKAIPFVARTGKINVINTDALSLNIFYCQNMFKLSASELITLKTDNNFLISHNTLADFKGPKGKSNLHYE